MKTWVIIVYHGERKSPFRCNSCCEQRQQQGAGLGELPVAVQLVKLTVFAYNSHALQG